MVIDTHCCGLYDGTGEPMNGTTARWQDIETLRPCVHLLYDVANPQPETVERILVLPAPNASIPTSWLAEAVASLDRNKTVAIHGIDAENVQTAITSILALAGGGQA